MIATAKRSPQRDDSRIILQFDYDCFYAQVVENLKPCLKNQPLGIQQKNILATCNYHARRRGVKKLMLLAEAKKLCPELCMVNGEDLTPFRNTSKTLFNFFRSCSWNDRVERLGFDEVFLDVTDMIDYNMTCLNWTSLSNSFFQLSKTDPLLGFECDLSNIAGCSEGRDTHIAKDDASTSLHLRLVLGSHLAQHIRQRLETEFGYTSTCGISTNKALSKMVGSKNKPRNQTTLVALDDTSVCEFLSNHTIRQIPGLGAKMVSLIESHILHEFVGEEPDVFHSRVSVRNVVRHPDVDAAFLEKLLCNAGFERGIGDRIWGLLHGVDPTPVKEANDIPSQISIEDTYKGLRTLPQITEQLYKLSCSLIRRMRVDLLSDSSNGAGGETSPQWLAKPRTLRLAIRSWPVEHVQKRDMHRISRSGPFPSFVFSETDTTDSLAGRLVKEAVLPLLRRMETEKGPTWNLQLINIGAANMEAGAGNAKNRAGRNISDMMKNQDELLRPWKVSSTDEEVDGDERVERERSEGERGKRSDTATVTGEVESESAALEDWDVVDGLECATCGLSLPLFAMPAHTRFHDMEEKA